MTDRIKANGIHYTPPELAKFMASAVREHARISRGPIHVLDPACGDGALLAAFAEAGPKRSRRRLVLTGYETDADALAEARHCLESLEVGQLILQQADFLELDGAAAERTLFESESSPGDFDVVIANPPYVRTQVLGSRQSRALAKRFGLTGRVDLYQAFAIGMANVLKPGGVLGLLTSNRFLTTRSGEALRRFLRGSFEIQSVYDLGDTKLFSAAVLPVVVIATKGAAEKKCSTAFSRVYETSTEGMPAAKFDHVLDAVVDGGVAGVVETSRGWFNVERGVLAASQECGAVWALSTPETDRWLSTIRSFRDCVVADVAKVRVGIKTTADSVFVRDDWESLPAEQQPENSLLHGLITHHEADRWCATGSPTRKVLYTHHEVNGARTPISLTEFPRAQAYLQTNEDRLRRRKYVIDSGRQWYEIWVPHAPSDWQREKVVFPDISEAPRFFFDSGGAIVQGDCYWIVTQHDVEQDWLFVILAVCNSTLIMRFYDAAFHNKLYSGRRRFMTQYVKEFPLPPLDAPVTKKLVRETKKIVADGVSDKRESLVNALVWEAFGLVEE